MFCGCDEIDLYDLSEDIGEAEKNNSIIAIYKNGHDKKSHPLFIKRVISYHLRKIPFYTAKEYTDNFFVFESLFSFGRNMGLKPHEFRHFKVSGKSLQDSLPMFFSKDNSGDKKEFYFLDMIFIDNLLCKAAVPFSKKITLIHEHWGA